MRRYSRLAREGHSPGSPKDRSPDVKELLCGCSPRQSREATRRDHTKRNHHRRSHRDSGITSHPQCPKLQVSQAQASVRQRPGEPQVPTTRWSEESSPPCIEFGGPSGFRNCQLTHAQKSIAASSRHNRRPSRCGCRAQRDTNDVPK